MQGTRFDWRWVALIVVVAIIVGGQYVPWPLLTLVLAVSGGYLLYMGWQIWNGDTPGRGTRVTYWRGQRIELPPDRRSSGLPPMRSLGSALIYFLLGAALVLSAAGVLWQHVGA